MGPDEPPPTADSRASKEDLPNPDAANTMLTTPAPPKNNHQVLSTPTPPETKSEKTANNNKLMASSDASLKSKGDRLSLAPGSVELTSPRASKNQRELSPKNKPPRKSTNNSVQSSESRTPLASVTRNSRQKGDKQQRGSSGQQPANDSADEDMNPGAVAVGLRSNTTNDFTVSPDLENPATQQQQQPSTTLLQAEVAPDMDEAIQRAVQDALRQRDAQMATAAVVANVAVGTPEETNNQNDENTEESDKKGSNGEDDQSLNKKILYAGIGFVVLVIVIVLAVTLSGGGESGDNNSNSISTTITVSPTAVSAPSTAPEAPVTITKPPTIEADNLSGDCTRAIPIFSSGYQASVTNSAVTATYVDEVCNVDVDDLGIWFLLEVPQGEEQSTALFTVSQQTFAAKMSIYTGSSCANLRCLDQTLSSSETPRTFEQVVESGASYFIFVAGNGSDQTGNFQFEFQWNEQSTKSPAIGDITPSPTIRITPSPTIQITPSPTIQITPSPTIRITPSPTIQITPSPTIRTTPSPTIQITPSPTIRITPSPTIQITPAPTLSANLPVDCRSASAIMAGFSQAISTTSGLDTFVNSQCVLREGDRGVWFKFIPTYEAIATLRASEQNFSAKLAYFTGTCNFPVCGARTTSGLPERVLSFHAEVGKEYLLFVGGNGSNNEGSLKLTLEAPSPPSFSYCTGAIDVSSSLPYDQRDSTVDTVPTLLNEECIIDSEDRGTWYKYAAIRDVIITVILSTQEKNTRMAFFTGSSCESLTCGGFTPGSVATRNFVFFAQPGEEYYILVASNGLLNAGNYRLQIIESAPPENSYFTGATKVISDYSNPFVKEDTTQFAVPSFSSNECFVKETDRGLWYRYTPTLDSVMSVTLSGDSFGKRLSMYTANCSGNDCDSLSCVKETGIGIGSDRVLEFPATLGTDFFFLVSGSNFEEVGNFVIRFDSSEPPENSYCSNADVFSSGAGSDAERREGNTAAAVPSFVSDSCAIANDDRGLWYKYTPTSDRMVQVILGEHDWIARLSYYTGNCISLECGLQTGFSGSDRILTMHATSGVDYYFLASGRDFDEAGPFQISIDAPAPPANSFCNAATEVSTVTLLGTTFVENTSTTVPSYSNPDCEIRGQDRGVWFKLPPSSASPGSAATVQVTGQEFDAKLSVFESEDSCSSLSCVISTPWSTSSRSLTWTYAEGKTYHVLVSGDGLFEAGRFDIKFALGFG